MPPPPTPTQLRRRRDLEIAKRQATFLVSITATIFILCPECLRIYRNLCIVPLLAWLTGLAFDLIESLSSSWDNAPALLKYFIPSGLNIRIAAPFDQMKTSVGAIMSRASLHVKPIAREARARIMAFRQAVLLVLVNWFLHQLGRDPVGENSSGKFEDSTPGPATTSDRWYGILVMTPPVHDYGSLSLAPNTREKSQPIPWDSHDTLSIPSISPPSDFRVHLSFCLVHEAVWESQDMTIAEKLKAGLYWDMSGKDRGADGERWAQACVQKIAGVEILGLVDKEQGTVNSCREYFASLRQGWNYMNISWNDVDFAIILGFLVIGPQATQSTNDLFIRFQRLRISQALVVRGDVPRMGALASSFAFAATGVATVLTGGLAAPLVVGSWISVAGLIAADNRVNARDADIWRRRIGWCQDLQGRFPQLEALFEG